MITLTFNTAQKKVILRDGVKIDSMVIEMIDNAMTVQPDEKGFYTILIDVPEVGRIPYLRVPINNTLMRIVNEK